MDCCCEGDTGGELASTKPLSYVFPNCPSPAFFVGDAFALPLGDSNFPGLLAFTLAVAVEGFPSLVSCATTAAGLVLGFVVAAAAAVVGTDGGASWVTTVIVV